MFVNPSFQNIRLTAASAFVDLESTPFFLKFTSTNANNDSYGEVCFHIENAPLAAALVNAINAVLAEYGVSQEPESAPFTPPDDEEILF